MRNHLFAALHNSSVTLRRHKAVLHLLRRSLALSTTNRQTASTIGTNRLRFAIHGGQRKNAPRKPE
ncbi:hypothetical protein [Candidatus Reidiella endopervernicosa]|uniref:Uncharacterized protein n=1 Tax=Candidatus Reidiella endopervernicosa TaxID=2738883 RepID=A0A6N0HY59_9GAMM|nr:hypothetical protein [Candidatus Reidiella endopervernicosa]QKQ27295.1 hypothetical protein HUE57_14135 [Candidatus Reidiella endopervernicosa]